MISCQFLYKPNLLWLPGQVLIGKKFLPVILYMTKDICFHQKLVVVLSYNKIHTSFSNFYEIQRGCGVPGFEGDRTNPSISC